jgi:hypothetical protein
MRNLFRRAAYIHSGDEDGAECPKTWPMCVYLQNTLCALVELQTAGDEDNNNFSISLK